MKLPVPFCLFAVEGAHTHDVVPYFIGPASGSDHHKGGGKAVFLIQFVGEGHMFFVIVNGIPAELTLNALQILDGDFFQLFLAHEPVPAVPPECVGVDLPLTPRVFLFALFHGNIRVGFLT